MPNPYLLTFLGVPALFIFSPFIKMFPVGLGLKMMIATTIFVTLTFLLLLPVFGFYRKKKRLAYISLILFFGCMISAHFNSGFDKDNAKPTSLLYVLDADTNKAQWATYENTLSDWTTQYLDNSKKAPEQLSDNTISSKYSSNFTYVTDAPEKEITPMRVEKTRDTIVGNNRLLEICITPERNINRLEVFTNTTIESAKVNSVKLSDYFLENRRGGRLITHYVSNNEYTDLQLSIPKDSVLELTIYEASNDLLSNTQFTIPARPENNIPMPFILNDAILVTKTVREKEILGDISKFLVNVDVLIVNIPPKLRGKNKESYVKKIELLHHEVVKNAKKQLPQPSTESGEQLLAAENIFKNDTNLDTTIIRFGGLIGPNRHPITMLSGRKELSNGNYPINLIHLNDCIRIITASFGKFMVE
ncbi:Protein YeeZ [Nymphon striatum]|nr:Protein YeeZ [Nymphon striatum]